MENRTSWPLYTEPNGHHPSAPPSMNYQHRANVQYVTQGQNPSAHFPGASWNHFTPTRSYESNVYCPPNQAYVQDQSSGSHYSTYGQCPTPSTLVATDTADESDAIENTFNNWASNKLGKNIPSGLLSQGKLSRAKTNTERGRHFRECKRKKEDEMLQELSALKKKVQEMECNERNLERQNERLSSELQTCQKQNEEYIKENAVIKCKLEQAEAALEDNRLANKEKSKKEIAKTKKLETELWNMRLRAELAESKVNFLERFSTQSFQPRPRMNAGEKKAHKRKLPRTPSGGRSPSTVTPSTSKDVPMDSDYEYDDDEFHAILQETLKEDHEGERILQQMEELEAETIEFISPSVVQRSSPHRDIQQGDGYRWSE